MLAIENERGLDWNANAIQSERATHSSTHCPFKDMVSSAEATDRILEKGLGDQKVADVHVFYSDFR